MLGNAKYSLAAISQGPRNGRENCSVTFDAPLWSSRGFKWRYAFSGRSDGFDYRWTVKGWRSSAFQFSRHDEMDDAERHYGAPS